MCRDKKSIIGIIAAILIVAAVVAAVIIYREQICEFLYNVKEKLIYQKRRFTSEECRDFADI